jgi:hypothetical protein
VLPYNSSSRGVSLLHRPGDIGYNVGLFVVVLLCALTATRQAFAKWSVPLAFASFLWWFPHVVSNTIDALHGGPSLRSGAYLAYVGVLALLIECIIAVRFEAVAIRVKRPSFKFSLIAGIIGVAWGVGEYLPWVEDRYTSLSSGVTFNSTHSSSLVRKCCTLFSNHYSLGGNTGLALEISLLVIGSVAVCFLLPRVLSGIGISAIAVAFAGEVIVGLRNVSNANPPLRNFYSGSGLSQAIANKVQVTVSGLPGLWINLCAEVLLLLLGGYVCLSSRIPVGEEFDNE